MTTKQFSQLALTLPEAVASEHMGHPDFRVGGKIFATLGWPDAGWGMVKLNLVQQAAYIQSHPEVFQAIENGWGRKGATSVHLKNATKSTLMPAMKDAWMNTAPNKIKSLYAE